MQTILVVEDNNDMQQMLLSMLQQNYLVIQAFSGTEGELLFSQHRVDLILLDRMLPGKNGDEVLNDIRKDSDVPVIMLTALDDSSEVAELLMNGADDYVTKPFNINELLARITVQLRNHHDSSQTSIMQYKNIQLLPDEYEIENGPKKIQLKKKEFDILALLFKNPQQIFTKKQLYEIVW
ncbi:two-component response regulator [Paucilactobacillus suebicus DSM 5007 = KCTC 3549]|uniref:Two-component response regulator n=1 Tax=Paucilactobacillus suebicus DSM 5007 = KCTC 3549 TaxID=1423807 RepID=A0A0R1WBV6_9LACO|nr:two-component response regulator [Paucilactobacillus suebicus DSM 5007 = KCTC 3549]